MPIDNEDNAVRVTAASAFECGQFQLTADGRVGVVNNMAPVAIGQVASLQTEGQAIGTAGATMTAGTIVGVIISSQSIVTAGTAASVPAGTLLYDVTSAGQARFDLNEFTGRGRAIGASTAAFGTTSVDATVLPAATAAVYPTTAANATTGVRIHVSDLVTGRLLHIGNSSAAVLKVYAPTGGAINGLAVDAAVLSVTSKGIILICTSSTANTWVAF